MSCPNINTFFLQTYLNYYKVYLLFLKLSQKRLNLILALVMACSCRHACEILLSADCFEIAENKIETSKTESLKGINTIFNDPSFSYTTHIKIWNSLKS